MRQVVSAQACIGQAAVPLQLPATDLGFWPQLRCLAEVSSELP